MCVTFSSQFKWVHMLKYWKLGLSLRSLKKKQNVLLCSPLRPRIGDPPPSSIPWDDSIAFCQHCCLQHNFCGTHSIQYNFFYILAIVKLHTKFCMVVGFISVEKCSGLRLFVSMVNACQHLKMFLSSLQEWFYHFMFPTEIFGVNFSIFAGFDVTF